MLLSFLQKLLYVTQDANAASPNNPTTPEMDDSSVVCSTPSYIPDITPSQDTLHSPHKGN